MTTKKLQIQAVLKLAESGLSKITYREMQDLEKSLAILKMIDEVENMDSLTDEDMQKHIESLRSITNEPIGKKEILLLAMSAVLSTFEAFKNG